MFPLRYSTQASPTNGLKNPTNDPAFPLAERSQTPFHPNLANNMNQPNSGNNFQQTMAQASRPASSESLNWPPTFEQLSDDAFLDEFVNFDDDQPTESATQMAVGPSQSSDSSHSSDSSSRQKNQLDSTRSSFSVTQGLSMPTPNHSLPLPSEFALAERNHPLATLQDVDAMNKMTSTLNVRSAGNSSPDSIDSNVATGPTIAGFSMPYETSPDVNFEPAAMNDPYSEPAIVSSACIMSHRSHLPWHLSTAGTYDRLQDSAEASPVTMAWPQTSLSAQLTNNNNPTLRDFLNQGMPPQTMPTQSFRPHSQTDLSHWYGHNQYKPAPCRPVSSQKPNYSNMIYLSPDPGPNRPPGRYFAIMSSRTGTRVETALDVRLVLADPPPGITRIRIHEEHLTKVKHLKDRHLPLSPDILELRVTVFCASALKSASDIQIAMNRAVNRDNPRCHPHAKDAGSPSKGSGEYRPLEGTPVQICEGCVSREAKRLRRSKPKNEETDEWLHDASRRTLVFNNNQLVDWKSPNSSNAAEQLLAQPPPPRVTAPGKEGEAAKAAVRKLPPPPIEPGTIAADLAMRICCYCRHQHESSGFR